MTDEEKKELQELINLLYNGHISQYGKRKLVAYIEKQQAEIEKKDRQLQEKENIIRKVNIEAQKYFETIIKKDNIIDKMAEQLAGLSIWDNDKEEPLILMNKKEVIEYYTNKVKGENNER